MKNRKTQTLIRSAGMLAVILSLSVLAACQDSLLNAPLGSVTVAITQAPVAVAGMDSATLTWKTDVQAVSWVEYGTVPGALDKATVKTSSYVTDHSIDLSGLAANTTYYYVVKSTNQSGNSVSSAELSFATGQLTVVGTVTVTPGAASATLAWTTNLAATSWVEYGTVSGTLDKSTVKTTAAATTHSIVISGLVNDTVYYYVVHSSHASGSAAQSTEANFSTSTFAITTQPSVTVATTSATVNWVTNLQAISWVDYGTVSGSLDKSTPKTSVAATAHGLSLPNLAVNTTYYYVVHSTNTSGGTISSTEGSFNSGSFSITTQPGVTPTTSSATIAWVTSQNAISWVDYGTVSGALDRSTVKTGIAAASHSISLSPLQANVTYYYVVHSTSSSGTSIQSTEATFNTSNFSISTGPAAVVSSTSATLSWATNLDACSSVEYGTVSGSLDKATVRTTVAAGSHAIVLTGLVPNTKYYYSVHSAHASGSLVQSTESDFTTSAFTIITTPSSVPSTTSASISWTTSENSWSWVEYGTTSGTYTGASVRTASAATSHGITLNNLTTGQTYYFRAWSETASGTQTSSAEYSFTTVLTATTIALSAAPAAAVATPVPAPAVIADTTSATVTFNTNFSGECYLEWGTASGAPYANKTTMEASSTTNHSFALSGLAWSRGAPSPVSTATYYYRVRSFSAANGSSISTEYSFTTPTITDATLSQRMRGIWLVGGVNTNNYASPLSTVEVFDPSMGTGGTVYSANIPALPTPVSFAGVAGYSGKVYVFGGWLSTGVASNAVQIYDVASNTWTTGVYTLPSSSIRAGLNATAASGKIYVYGGTAATANGTWAASNTMWEFIPGTGFNASAFAAISATTDRAAVSFNDALYYLGGRTAAAALGTAHDGYTVTATSGTPGITSTATEVVLTAARMGMNAAIYAPTGGQAQMIVTGGLSVVAGNQPCPALFTSGTFLNTAQYLGYPFVAPDVWTTGVNSLPAPVALGAAAIGTDSSGKARYYLFGGTLAFPASGSSQIYSSDLTTSSLFASAWTTHAIVPLPIARLGHGAVTVQ